MNIQLNRSTLAIFDSEVNLAYYGAHVPETLNPTIDIEATMKYASVI